MYSVLTLDMGNSGLKAAFFENGEIRKRWKFRFDTGFEYASEVLKDCMPEGVAVCSVVPVWTVSFLDKIDRGKYERVLCVNSEVDFPFPILLPSPEKIGADRLCAVCGVVKQGIKEAVIVDIGTAITVDVLSFRGYEGGTIFPGAEMILNSLFRETAALPELRELPVEGVIPGKSTEEAISGGTLWGVIGAIEMLIKRSLDTLSPSAEIIITGGGADNIHSKLNIPLINDPDLVFKGLLGLYEDDGNI